MHIKSLLKKFPVILAVFISLVQADDFQDALKAYQDNNYALAVKLYKPLAEKGDSRAQYNLGLAYARQGVNQSKLSRKAFFQSRSAGLIDSYFLPLAGHNVSLVSPRTWLFSQDKQNYTLQLATGKTPENLEKFRQRLISGKKLKQAQNLFIFKDNTAADTYILIYGVFDSRQNAQAEKKWLQDSVMKTEPWIRPFGKIQPIVSKSK